MKQLFASLALLLAAGYAQSQTTYYFVGGTATSSFTANSNWNTAQNGSGTVRTAALPDDVLIIDGTNVGGTAPATGPVTLTLSSTVVGQLRIQGNAALVLQRPAGGGGTGTLSINGGSGTDFIITAGSSLTLNSPTADGNTIINLLADVTGLINGTLEISNTGGHRITSQTEGGLVFGTGGVANTNTQSTTTAYPFGNNTQADTLGVVFQAGATLNNGGRWSPMGNNSGFQALNMLPGSNFNQLITPSASTGSYTNQKAFGNYSLGAGVTFVSDGPIYRIGTLTIPAGASFTTHTSGQTPVLGDLVVNGSLQGPAGSTNNLVMGGTLPQTISGSGTMALPNLTVANNSTVTLQRNVTVLTATTVLGTLNMGTFNINGTGTFTSRVNSVAGSVAGNTTAGSFQITGVSGALAGNNGLVITGTNLPAGTNVVGFGASAGIIYLNRPATATGQGLVFEFSSDTATLSTNNANGFDSTNGSVIAAGLKTFQAGTNFVVNAATARPVGITSGNAGAQAVGSLTLNAEATTNATIYVGGNLVMNSGKLTVRSGDSLRLNGLKALVGAPFSAAKYIVTQASGASVGVVRLDTVTTARTLPVGSASLYLPVTFSGATPQSLAVSAVAAVTSNGAANGTTFTAPQLANVANAMWMINRVDGAGAVNLGLAWPSSVEGTNFAAFGNAQIGISRYNGNAWESAIGGGDNVANTATASFTDFGSFGVGRNGQALPVRLTSFTQQQRNGLTEIAWTTEAEVNMAAYTLELSANGRDFNYLHRAEARNSSGTQRYQYAASLAPGTYLARLMMEEKDGRRSYSALLPIEVSKAITVRAYPNPVKDVLMVEGLELNDVVILTDLQGRTVAQVRASNHIQAMQMYALSAGQYRLQVVRQGVVVNSQSILH